MSAPSLREAAMCAWCRFPLDGSPRIPVVGGGMACCESHAALEADERERGPHDLSVKVAAIVVALVRCIHGAVSDGKVTPALAHQVERLASLVNVDTAARLRRALDPTPIDSFAPRIVQSVAGDTA